MDSEQEASKKIEVYKDLAAENKNVDVGSLMISALEQAQQDEIAAKKKRWAYLVSVGLPPFGLLYALRYYFSDKAGAKRVALICVILTVISLLAAWLIAQMFLASAGPELNQIQSLNPGDLKDFQNLLQ